MSTRRQFLHKFAAGAAGFGLGAGVAASPVFGAAGEDAPGRSVVLPEAKVSIMRSGRDRAMDITAEEVEAMVRGAVARAGGFGEAVRDGSTVILKVNMVSWYDESKSRANLPLEASGVATDWRVARAAVALVREYNPHGRVIILEGVANSTTRQAMEWLGYNHDRIPGVDEFIYLEEQSGKWEEWGSPNLVTTTLPKDIALYPDNLKPNKSPEFYLNRTYFEADTVISLPVLKNHTNANVTGAVKNLGIGGAPQNIYGGAPGDNHRFVNNRISHNPLNLHQWIHDFYLCRPAGYAIMDGIQGTSHGPVAIGADSLADAQQNMRMVLAGRNPVALDAVASYLMCRDPRKVRHLSMLAGHGVGPIEPAAIRMDEVSVAETRKRFKLPGLMDVDASYAPPEPPALTVGDCSVRGSALRLRLTAGASTVKVEVAVNGETLPVTVTGGFDDFEVELPEGTAPKRVTVTAYDRCFGSTTREADITVSAGSKSGAGSRPLELLPNRPNPFNPSTVIPFRLEKPGPVRLAVYSITGSLVEVLASGWRAAGLHTVCFDGRRCASGTYVCRLESGSRSETRKMLLVK